MYWRAPHFVKSSKLWIDLDGVFGITPLSLYLHFSLEHNTRINANTLSRLTPESLTCWNWRALIMIQTLRCWDWSLVLKRYLDDAEEVMDDGTGSLIQSETYLFDKLHHRILWHPRKSFSSNWQVVDVTKIMHFFDSNKWGQMSSTLLNQKALGVPTCWTTAFKSTIFVCILFLLSTWCSN